MSKNVVNPICALKDMQIIPDNVWIAGDSSGKHTVLVFPADLGRDDVRGAYAKTLGTKRDNARAIRHANYVKNVPSWGNA
jgi:hypothetical protein